MYIVHAFSIGDPANLASRLEGLAAKGEILVGEQTFRQRGIILLISLFAFMKEMSYLFLNNYCI
jgi:class 3 adenylate cyclase